MGLLQKGEERTNFKMQEKAYPSAPSAHKNCSNRKTSVGNGGKTARVYRVWQGSNRFCFGGRLIFGPDVRSMIITIFLIAIPVILFTVFVSHKLISEFTHGITIIIVPVVFAAYIIVLLFLTSSRDPGIIPRNAHPPEPEDDSESSSIPVDWMGGHGARSSLPPTKDVLVNGIIVRVKYCHTCMLYRPPRCSHCSICNNCVERFDHHCPWVGQCIGKRNYRFFYMFVTSTTLLCLYVFIFCWINLAKIMGLNHCNLWKAIVESPVSAILIIYTFIAAWFVGGLSAFHTYLVCTNQTTYENFRYRYDGKVKNPYNLGCFLNISEIFFSRIPKSKNHFRARVKAELPTFSTLPLGKAVNTHMAKVSNNMVLDEKRQAVGEEEFDDIQSQMESVGRLDRCGTLRTDSSLGSQKGNWEITPDIEVIAAEFGMEHGAPNDEDARG